jgi:trk system potassium uptake protein TrkA
MDSIFIIGAGRFGRALAARVAHGGREVVVLDRDRRALDALPSSFAGAVIQADAREIEQLASVGFGGGGVVVAATHDDNLNLALALAAGRMFSAERAVVLLRDPSRRPLFEAFDVEVLDPMGLAVGEAMKVGGWS